MKTGQRITLDAGKHGWNDIRPFLSTLTGFLGAMTGSSRQNGLRNLLIACLFFFAPLSPSVSEGQISSLIGAQAPYNANSGPFPDPFHAAMDGPLGRQQIEKQYKALNAQRQRQLTSDSARLLALAVELKADLDKESKDLASPEEMHKAEQIERLAHSVRDKMKDVDSPAQPFMPIPRKLGPSN